MTITENRGWECTAKSSKDIHAQLTKSHIDSKWLDCVPKCGIIVSNETHTGDSE